MQLKIVTLHLTGRVVGKVFDTETMYARVVGSEISRPWHFW